MRSVRDLVPAKEWIPVPQPSMALNSPTAPCKYRMYNSWDVPWNRTPKEIFDWAASVGRGCPRGRLHALVINCHGEYSKADDGKIVGGFGLQIGKGLHLGDVGTMSVLRGTVDQILITACGTARIANPGKPEGDGNAFCSAMARAAGCTLVAATTQQMAFMWAPKDHISNWEGNIVTYNSNGAIVNMINHGIGILDRWSYGPD